MNLFEEATGRVLSEMFPAKRKVYLLAQVLNEQVTAEEVSRLEADPMGVFFIWTHYLL